MDHGSMASPFYCFKDGSPKFFGSRVSRELGFNNYMFSVPKEFERPALQACLLSASSYLSVFLASILGVLCMHISNYVLLILNNEITIRVFFLDVETLPYDEGCMPVTYSVVFVRAFFFIKINKRAGTHGIIFFSIY